MYLKSPRRDCTSAGHIHRAAPFLMLQHVKNTPSNEVYGVVRKVALKQYGHFMMGIARIMNKSITVSGCYGNDGLIMDVDSVPPDAVRLPDHLYTMWAKGGGWNGAGDEAVEMMKWGRETFKC